MNATELIKDVMSRYYITKEIKDRKHLIEVLNKEITIDQFNEAINDLSIYSNSDLVADILYVGFVMKCFNKKNEPTLRGLLLLNSHESHEDIVSLFQLNYNNSIENISMLLNAIKNIPDYLNPDDFKYPYIRKIIYAIGAQPSPYNVEALENLINETDDEQIRDLALHQIEKRKKLGRWEAARLNMNL